MRLHDFTKTAACLLGASLLVAGGCAEDTAPIDDQAFEGPGIQLNVGALTLTGVDDGCYNFVVRHTANDEIVVQQDRICGSQFGAGADITYISPCDASGDGLHTVELTLEALCAGDCVDTTPADGVTDNPLTDYVNACPAGTPCVQADVQCTENADTLVQFDLVIMRQANQGFFDIAVNFNDIFCSAKFDCAYPGDLPNDPSDDEEITLLFNDTGARDRTAVLGFACTAGPGAGDTVLAMSSFEIACFDNADDFAGSFMMLDPDADGNIDLSAEPFSPLYAAMVSRGEEQLLSGGASANKVYWNVALGYKDLDGVGNDLDNDATCYLAAEATALPGNSQNVATPATPDSTTYPVLEFNIQLTDEAGDRVCTQHPLDLSVALPENPNQDDTYIGVNYQLGGTGGYNSDLDGFKAYPAP